jgi:hypothetical protein
MYYKDYSIDIYEKGGKMAQGGMMAEGGEVSKESVLGVKDWNKFDAKFSIVYQHKDKSVSPIFYDKNTKKYDLTSKRGGGERYATLKDAKLAAYGDAKFNKMPYNDLDESKTKDTNYLYAIPKWLIEEIKESIKLGFDKLETGLITPNKKGLLLVNKDYKVRGTYNLQLKIPIQKIIDESKTEDIEQVEIKKDADIDYTKTIKEGNKYGDWSLMAFDPIVYNDNGSISGGYIRLVNQDTIDKLEILYAYGLRGNEWYIRYGGVQIHDKNPKIVIEKVLKLANKNIDESKTEDIMQVEIKKENNIDNLIKALEISLKFANTNDKLNLENLIKALKIGQKYEIGEDTENQDERALKQLNKLKEEGKLKRYVDTRGNGKKVYDTIVPNKSEKGMYKRYESLSQSLIGILQNEYLDEADVLNWLKKTMPKR